VFPSVAAGGPIDFSMFGRAIAEFELARLDPVLLKPGDVRQDGTVRRTR
jgi:hypothetical protein